MGTVLVVDDEAAIRDGLARAVASKGHTAQVAGGLAEARAKLRELDIDCVLLDVRLPDGDGLDLLREIRTRDGETPVIMATAYGDSQRAIAAMKAGAFEYVTKPFDLPLLLGAVDRAVKAKALSRVRDTPAAPVSGETLIGSSAAMLDVWKVIGRAAASDVPVLIVGETGTGKDLVARAIHENGARATGPFVPVNLASLSANLIESELMGHEKGAFTGAVALHRGRLEKAASGTLFLDEIGDLDSTLQTKLLRVLQDGRFERVGGSETLASDARIIAATHKEVRPGQPGATLREDLYYRLAVIEVAIPPLRARKSDIPLLVAHALRRTRARAVSEEAMTMLLAYDWPGNVRELIHVIERASVMCSMEVIDTADLPAALAERSKTTSLASFASPNGPAIPLREALAALEKQMIVHALERANGNRAEAARILGIARPQLYTKLTEHGLGDPKGK
jgi:two-component system response regulator AtoC